MDFLTSGAKIKQLRREKMLTQKQLAEKCGMHESAIGRIETSKGTPRTETLDKIAKALGVKSSELLPDWTVVTTYDGRVYEGSNSDLVDKLVEAAEKRWDKEDPHSMLFVGSTAVDETLCENTVKLMQKMNLSGKLRVLHYAEDLSQIAEYMEEK